MSLILQQSAIRWKEWIPLVTQQQRFRNLIQIIGFNIGSDEIDSEKSSSEISYYYTLHLTTMCAPFYTSEKISKSHPKWTEINFVMIDPSFGSATGIVIRVWQHYKDVDTIITVWGVYFSGLTYIGSYVEPEDRKLFTKNTLVFNMHGGYFTLFESMVENGSMLARVSIISMSVNDVRQSYTVETLSRLHSVQRSIKEVTEESVSLHSKILHGQFPEEKQQIKENSAFLRKLLNQTKPNRVTLEQILSIRKSIESTKFRVQILQEQKSLRLAELKKRANSRNNLVEKNQNDDSALRNRYHTLHEDIERLKEWRKSFIEGKENLLNVKSHFTFRQRQLIADLALIYPIKNVGQKYTICDVHLPNSEDFDGVNELSLSVALGYTAHLVQKISLVINIPLRYPVIHFGSQSKIVDHIADKLPDKDREFPLFIKGKDKLQFNYAVYLLNKNIAQLRWYCGISTIDLRTTLPNLETLLNLHSTQKNCTYNKESQVLFDDFMKIPSIPKNSFQHNSVPNRLIDNLHKNSRLSYSLDHGLDRWDNSEVKSQNGSAPISHYEGQSSDSAEQFCSAKSSSEIERAECEIFEDQSSRTDFNNLLSSSTAVCGTKSDKVDSS